MSGGDGGFSPTDEPLSPTPDLDITIEEGSENSEQLLEEEEHEIDSEKVFRIESNDPGREPVLGIESNDLQSDGDQVLRIENNHNENNSDQMLEIESNYHENGADCDTTIDQNGGKGYHPPIVGMEFESYDDAYNYYNCYAKELGFAIRVKSSWTKRNSKEKRGAVLCCNCEGFKTIKEASTRRKETRTGCLAMIRLRLVESNRWRVDEVKLEHNHLFDPERAQNSKSHKKMDAGAKRKLEPPIDVEVRTIKLYRTPVVDTAGYGSSSEREVSNHVDESKRLKLKKGDAQVIHNYFCRMQLTNPNFFYVMDINDEGHLRHVFWIEPRSRAAYGYFGDVVALDTTCLSSKCEVPLVSFVGVNHHGQSILLGCGLLADETLETYVWLLRTWLTCMLGRPPQTILTDQCKALQTAIAEVFPRAHHRLCLSLVMQSILENSGELRESEEFQTVLGRIVHNSVKVDEFEIAWEDMIQRFGIKDHNWLQTLYEDRERWAPVYSKDTVFAGMFAFQPGELTNLFFDGYVHKETSLKEFFDTYELVLQKKYQKESLDDFESKESIPMLKTRCPYESQLSKVYTKELFLKFQEEVDMMASCLSITQIHANGPIITYMVKEREDDGNLRGIKNFEVVYDKAGLEVRCICSCFNFKGYLCRHALCVLTYNGVEEIPVQYILPRWRKDMERLYVLDLGSNSIDITNPVQWYDHLCKKAVQVVEEGMRSQDHYMAAWQAFKESLNKPASVPPISELGPDALLEPMTIDELINSLSKKKIGIKALLLDQSFISSIGNWIADEVLYQAKIHPLQIASSLSKESCVALHKCIKEVIEKAVEVGADSSQFPSSWIFHSREKKPGKAFVDGKTIEFIAAGGRTTAYVPELQKLSGSQVAKAQIKPRKQTVKKGSKDVDMDGDLSAPGSEDEENAKSAKSKGGRTMSSRGRKKPPAKRKLNGGDEDDDDDSNNDDDDDDDTDQKKKTKTATKPPAKTKSKKATVEVTRRKK